MAITEEEITRFTRFLTENRTNADNVLDLAEAWAARQHGAEDLASIKRGIADMEAGRSRPLDEVDKDIRDKLGFSPGE